MSEYVRILRNSDLTLNPAGKNVECYRIYEAMAVGSVPVIEDVPVMASCGTATASDSRRQLLRLLKQYNAPVIYISDWSELPAILQRELSMSLIDVVARRINVVRWYQKFRRKMQDVFVHVIHQKFFDS